MNAKRKRFVLEYMKDLNATQAALRAGYSERTAKAQGSRLLTYADIQHAIATLVADKAWKAEVSIERVLQELVCIAYARQDDYCEIDEAGQLRLKTFGEMSEAAIRAIKSVQEDRIIKESADGTRVTVHDKVKYVLHDKNKAIELIGKYLAMWTDVVKHYGTIKLERGDTEWLTTDELQRWADGELTDEVAVGIIASRKPESGARRQVGALAPPTGDSSTS